MGTKRVGLARVEALLENLKRDIRWGDGTSFSTYDANDVGTGFDGAETCNVKVFKQNGEIVTTIMVDITGLADSGTVKDVIGEGSGGFDVTYIIWHGSLLQ